MQPSELENGPILRGSLPLEDKFLIFAGKASQRGK